MSGYISCHGGIQRFLVVVLFVFVIVVFHCWGLAMSMLDKHSTNEILP